MAQVAHARATMHELMAPPAFSKGFDDAWRGAPPRYDIEPPPGGGLSTNRLWAYERGRAFAIYCKAMGRGDPRPFKRGNRVLYHARDLFQDAIRARYVI